MTETPFPKALLDAEEARLAIRKLQLRIGRPDEAEAVKATLPYAVRAVYKNHRGEVAERRFIPISFAFEACDCHGPEPFYTSSAYCLDRKALRSFSMAGFLTGWQPLGDPATRPDWASPPIGTEAEFGMQMPTLATLCDGLGKLAYKLNMGENTDPDFVCAVTIAGQLEYRLLGVLAVAPTLALTMAAELRERADVEDLSPSGNEKVAIAFRQLADELERDGSL